MARTLQNYLRTYRKRAGLSQEEVAFLLGCRTEAVVSRYETGVYRPSLATILVYEKVFGAQAQELFRGLFQQVENETRKRAQILAEQIRQAKPRRGTSRKLRTLDAMLSASSTETGDHL